MWPAAFLSPIQAHIVFKGFSCEGVDAGGILNTISIVVWIFRLISSDHYKDAETTLQSRLDPFLLLFQFSIRPIGDLLTALFQDIRVYASLRLRPKSADLIYWSLKRAALTL
jgi:hypothetical protein